MKTKEVFQILQPQLEPPLSELGFVRCKDSTGQRLIWSRPFGKPKFETVDVQIDKWQFDPWLGSQFRVNFNRSSTKGNVALGKHSATLHQLLTAAELRQVKDLQNSVIAKRRFPTRAEYKNLHGEVVTYEFYDFDEPPNAPVKYSKKKFEDIWLRYIGPPDADQWGDFLAKWLPAMLARNQTADWSEFGW